MIIFQYFHIKFIHYLFLRMIEILCLISLITEKIESNLKKIMIT